MSTLVSLLRLARISNLPTVWSNVLAASVLGGGLAPASLGLVLLAMSALYTGGMILNDYFDREIDARERPERPLPSGRISSSVAGAIGGGLLVVGVGLLSWFGMASAVAGAALAGAILLYDAWHKGNPASPLIMGACRALVYVGTVLAAGAALTTTVLGSALALLLYIAGLTQAAKGGTFRSPVTFWPALLMALPIAHALAVGEVTGLSIVLAVLAAGAIGRAVGLLRAGHGPGREQAVGLLIATIALLDAVVASTQGDPGLALVCVALFVLTLALQRIVSGT